MLSYAAFLLHPLLINGIYLVLLSDEETKKKIESWILSDGALARFALLTAAVLANYYITWFFAAIMYVLVDRPGQDLGAWLIKR